MIPSQQQRLLFVLLLGVLLAVFMGASRLGRRSRPLEGQASTLRVSATSSAPGDAPGPLVPDVSDQRNAQRQYAAKLSWGRDPFTRGSAAGEVSGLVLSGILWDPYQPMAIINGQPVRVGDTLEEYRIVEIAEDRVALTDGTQTFQLHIAP